MHFAAMLVIMPAIFDCMERDSADNVELYLLQKRFLFKQKPVGGLPSKSTQLFLPRAEISD